MWIIALAGAAGMVATGIMDAEDYVDYEVEREDFDYQFNDDVEESITIMRHYPDGTVEVEQ